jgi:hypothetical protein
MVFPVSWSKIATSQGYALARILSRDVEESATSFRRACMDVQSLGRGCDSNFTQSWDSNSNFIKMPDSRAHSSMDALAATTQKHPAILLSSIRSISISDCLMVESFWLHGSAKDIASPKTSYSVFYWRLIVLQLHACIFPKLQPPLFQNVCVELKHWKANGKQ